MTFMGMVPIVGQMEEFMKVNGTKIKCMEKDWLNGRTGNHMMGNILKIKSREMERLFGMMEESTLGIGIMADKMELDNITWLMVNKS